MFEFVCDFVVGDYVVKFFDFLFGGVVIVGDDFIFKGFV